MRWRKFMHAFMLACSSDRKWRLKGFSSLPAARMLIHTLAPISLHEVLGGTWLNLPLLLRLNQYYLLRSFCLHVGRKVSSSGFKTWFLHDKPEFFLLLFLRSVSNETCVLRNRSWRWRRPNMKERLRFSTVAFDCDIRWFYIFIYFSFCFWIKSCLWSLSVSLSFGESDGERSCFVWLDRTEKRIHSCDLIRA